MFRVAENFTLFNGKSLEFEGLHVGKLKKCSFFVMKRSYSFVKDYESRENYEKNFKVLNNEMVEILGNLDVKDIPSFEKNITVVLLDEPKTESEPEPMTFRKWRENRIKNHNQG